MVYIYIYMPVLAFGYCRCLCLQVCLSVCVCVCESRVCLHDNSSLVQVRITKFGPEVQNIFFKVPFVSWGDQPWPWWSNLTWKWNFISFWSFEVHTITLVYEIGSHPLVCWGKKHPQTSAFSGNRHWKVMGTGPYEVYGPVLFWMSFIHYNSSPVQSRINKFGPEVQNALVKIPIDLGGSIDLDLNRKSQNFI